MTSNSFCCITLLPCYALGSKFLRSKMPREGVNTIPMPHILPSTCHGFPSCITMLIATLFLLYSCSTVSSQVPYSVPLSCGNVRRVCIAYVYYAMPTNMSVSDVQTLFNVGPDDIIEDPTYVTQKWEGLYVQLNCSCSSSFYFANTTYTMDTGGPVHLSSILDANYEGLAWAENGSVAVTSGSEVPISILCGCPDNTWQYLLSYVAQEPDSPDSVASRFMSSEDALAAVNNISDYNLMYGRKVYYVPINSGLFNTPPPTSPAVTTADHSSKNGVNISVGIILAIVGGGVVLMLVTAVVVFYMHKMCIIYHHNTGRGLLGTSDDFKSTQLQNYSGQGLSVESLKSDASASAGRRRTVTLSREMMTGVFGTEKPVVFTYEEVNAATNEFNESNILGKGAFGSVYYGLLRDQEVAIKRMKATKTKQFLAEIKVLCKVHHTNLIELIGYAASEDELFLVYEYAEHRSLSDRLHDPLEKGFTPLTWNLRVQIALDTAQGLEYIHEHTKTHYVHRDIKTRNILLDGSFQAKIADFGLAKLVEKTGGEASSTRIVGTFGYLAPEYLRDGQATAKTDVYAFGVVLFELLTGKKAISKSTTSEMSTPERRSLISLMLEALQESPNALQMSKLLEHLDPNLIDMYPQDCFFKIAKLAQQCVEEDPMRRPDIRHIVFTLSQILLSSIEWEATLAGNSQVFSGLIQGR